MFGYWGFVGFIGFMRFMGFIGFGRFIGLWVYNRVLGFGVSFPYIVGLTSRRVKVFRKAPNLLFCRLPQSPTRGFERRDP